MFCTGQENNNVEVYEIDDGESDGFLTAETCFTDGDITDVSCQSATETLWTLFSNNVKADYFQMELHMRIELGKDVTR
ncbi:unnamed protein product [Pleuronectes platessa]|uniref:Uncharacterized protein n=1 Tax=Pleuronectes platessa TaxID=8262 RepID=A0A9N7VY94_PLEPL|nr:unnamed protein product [Pleuronectes platessa]